MARRGGRLPGEASESLNRIPVIDGHTDVVRRVRAGDVAFFQRNTTGQVDWPRLCEGGWAAAFFAVWLDTDELDDALRSALRLIDTLWRLVEESAGKMRVVQAVEDLDRALAGEFVGAILHLEGAEPIDPDCVALRMLHRLGLRSLGLVWSRPNRFGTGTPFVGRGSPDLGPGLEPAGPGLVDACVQLGVAVDLAHLNERGFWEVAERIGDRRPLLVTHSNAHALSPSPRNLTDAQIRAVAQSGGVIGLNFHVGFLTADTTKPPDAGRELVLRHLDHIAGLVGTEHVALGSDFDGATMPVGLADVSAVQALLALFAGAGYAAEDICRIAHANLRRVLGHWWVPGRVGEATADAGHGPIGNQPRLA